jgi:DNA-binding CsgD family transcriptional regulator
MELSMRNEQTYEELQKRVQELERKARTFKKTEKTIRSREEELKVRIDTLEEANSALRVLLTQKDEDKKEIEERVVSNVRELVLPFLHNLKQSKLDLQQSANLHILEANLNSIISPFSRTLSTKYLSLTPQEIQIANLIKEGKNNRETAELMNLSRRTVESHRENMRRKMGLKHKRANLRAHLLSL